MGAPVTHWQIVTKQPDKLVEFYTRLFGWTMNDKNPLRYRTMQTGAGRGIDGGIWPAPAEANGFVQLHVEVDDVRARVELALGLGAKVVIPPQRLPAGDEMAVLHDPDGIPFALHSPAQ